MKKLYILFLFVMPLFAQNIINEQVVQNIVNGQINYEVRPKTAQLNRVLKKDVKPSQLLAINADEYLSEESFEDAFFPPNNWYLWTPGSTNWQQNTVEFYSGSNSAFSAGEPNSEAWLITPSIDLTSATEPVLSFYDFFDNTSAAEYNDEHMVKISTDYTGNGNPISATWDDIYYSDIYEYQAWRREQINLEDYNGETIYIAFYYAGNNIGSGSFQYGTDWYIDNVLVGEKEIESFEGDFFPPNNWNSYTYDFNEWDQEYGESVAGHNAAIVYGEPETEAWLISKSYDLTGATDPTLIYYDYFQYNGFPGDEHLVKVSTNYTGGDPSSAVWTTIYSDVFDYYEWNLRQISLGVYVNQTIHVAFQYIGMNFEPEAYGTDWMVDEVFVSLDGTGGCTGSEPIPDCATINSPPNGATLMQADVGLSWNPPFINTTKQLLYVGTDGGGTTTPTNVKNGIEYSYNASGITLINLSSNTTYYWQIVPANQCNEAQNCPIWSFTTGDGEVNYGGGGPTQGGYIYANSTSGASGAPSQPAYSWVEISGTGTDLISSITDESTKGPYNIGFPFQFFGNTYSQFYINSNGFITFGSTTGQTNFPHPIPSYSLPDDMIAGYWMNLNPVNPNVTDPHLYYGMNSGNMVITFEKIGQVEWNGFEYVPADGDAWITFQIIIYPNGKVKIQFKEKGISFVDAGAVGIESSDGSQGILYKRYSYGGPIFNGVSPIAVEFNPSYVTASAELKIFLEGPYNSPNMNSVLGASLPLNQPYSPAPWSYGGSESTSLSTITTNNIVDWVYIELRQGSSASNATSVVSKRAALLRNDGVILDIDGSTGVDFTGVSPGDYYVAIFHRNHLSAISSLPVTF